MSILDNLINIGNVVNDGLGDDLRTAFRKVNENFIDLNTNLGVTASNVGTTGYGVFKQKVDTNLEFKTISPGERITIADNDDVLIISTEAAFKKILTNSGEVLAKDSTSVTIEGTNNIAVTSSGSVVSIDTVLDLNRILLTYDFGTIGGSYENAVQFLFALSNTDFGTFENPADISLDVGSI